MTDVETGTGDSQAVPVEPVQYTGAICLVLLLRFLGMSGELGKIVTTDTTEQKRRLLVRRFLFSDLRA